MIFCLGVIVVVVGDICRQGRGDVETAVIFCLAVVVVVGDISVDREEVM